MKTKILPSKIDRVRAARLAASAPELLAITRKLKTRLWQLTKIAPSDDRAENSDDENLWLDADNLIDRIDGN